MPTHRPKEPTTPSAATAGNSAITLTMIVQNLGICNINIFSELFAQRQTDLHIYLWLCPQFSKTEKIKKGRHTSNRIGRWGVAGIWVTLGQAGWEETLPQWWELSPQKWKGLEGNRRPSRGEDRWASLAAGNQGRESQGSDDDWSVASHCASRTVPGSTDSP